MDKNISITITKEISSLVDELLEVAKRSRDYFAIKSALSAFGCNFAVDEVVSLHRVSQTLDNVLYRNDDMNIRAEILRIIDEIRSIANAKAVKQSAKVTYETLTEEEKDALYQLLWNRQIQQKYGKIYGVEQSCHGHNHRWIFDEKTLKAQGIDLSKVKDDIYEDIGFPIGGSNSSATYIIEMDSIDKIKGFLLSEYCTDLEDPMLVDIAEGICTIEVGDDSITRQYMEMLQIPENLMTRENGYFAEAKNMIQDLQKQGVECKLDFENPFYGTSKDMRLSELRELHKNIA